jgi:hypothetical protein
LIRCRKDVFRGSLKNLTIIFYWRFENMISFDESIQPFMQKRLGQLEEWFEAYASGGLLGQGLKASSLGLRNGAQPTIVLIEDIDDISVLAAEDLGDSRIQIECDVSFNVELALNDEEDNYHCTWVSMIILLELDTEERVIKRHRVISASGSDN